MKQPANLFPIYCAVLGSEFIAATFCERTLGQLEVESDRKWNVMNMPLQTE
jgi:hypothetical protein